MVGLELEKLLTGDQIEPYEAQAKAHDQPDHYAFPTWLVVLQFGPVLPRRRWYIKRRAVARRVSSDPASHWLVVRYVDNSSVLLTALELFSRLAC